MTISWNAAICVLLTSGFCGSALVGGQTISEAPPQLSRIIEPINEARLVQLRGNTRPEARPEFDLGRVDPQLPMQRMLLVLQRSPEQEAALELFMAQQLDPHSPDFHHWLDPEQFGALYGPSQNDIQSVSAWLENHGFAVDNVTRGRTFIEFSGTAALVQQAFHTEIHHYKVNGEEHIANSSDPSIPEALSPVVAGVVSLSDFFTKPLHRDLGAFHRDAKTGKWTPLDESTQTKPLFGVPVTVGTFEMVSPYDFATIYNVLPLWTAGIDGTGQTIAIAGRSDISLTDVANFRTAFNLPANAPTIIVNGPDPGVPSAGDKTENTLDVEWSGGVAKGANIVFVTTASTSTSDGAVISAEYIIDNKIAPVMSFSYGSCELKLGTGGNAAFNSIWQQGAAEGISEFVASGDQGSAACDGGGTAPFGASNGLEVSGGSSTPYDIAVGGTDLNWANNPGTTYWNAANNVTNLSSAIGYIPEVPWNGTCVSDAVDLLIGGTKAGFDEEQTCQALLTQGIDTFLINVVGGTGGVSACTTPSGTTPATCSGGYAKPSWQSGTGVPADGKRDVPDVSLFASSGTLNSAYVICDSASTACDFSNASDAIAQAIGGTSVSSPAMAGIMALINQKMGSAQGNANAGFYGLAAQDTRSSCNTNTVASGNSCNFYDITTDNNAVPCVPTTTNCTLHHTGDSVGVLNGYTSNVGYDLTTGLGSINAFNLVSNWHLIASSTLIPVATTAAATSVAATAATVTGTVNPEGSSTEVYFLYGTDSALSGATQTPMQSAGSGSTTENMNANLTGLTLHTKYYYQLWASNSAGTSAGSINSFTTVPQPPVTVSPQASSITTTQSLGVTVTVSGTPTPTGNVTVSGGSYTSAPTTLVSGSATITIPAQTLTAGSYTFTATYTPDGGSSSIYGISTGTAASSVTVSLTTPSISWTPASTILFSSAGGNVLTANSNGVSGSFTYSATPTGGGSATDITSGTATLAVGSYNITANFTPTNSAVYSSAQSGPVLLVVSGESVWIVDGAGGTSELAGDGYDITSGADPGANHAVAIDNSGNVWTVGTGSNLLEEASQTGTSLRTISLGTGGLSAPAGTAIDGNGQVWVTNGNNSISLFANAGTALSPSTGFTDSSLSTPSGIAVDTSGSVWVVNKGNNSVTRILGTAAPAAPLSTAAANKTTGAKP